MIQVTPAATMTDYPLPPGSAEPTSIVAGPDGAMWFTEERADRIGRITTAGALSEFPLPPGSEPRAIVVGADGAMWFTEYGSRKIGRIATDGTVAEYPLAPGTGSPNRLTLGPEGDVWFTEAIGTSVTGYADSLADEVGRVDPQGGLTTFAVAAQSGGTGPIAIGPEGRLWFATGRGPTAEMEWIEPDGRSGLPICAGACSSPVSDLALGPEGRLWASYDSPLNGGGGGSGLLTLQEPGHIGPLDFSAALALGLHLGPIQGRRTWIEVECTAPAPCRGKLTGKVARVSTEPTVTRATYSLSPGQRQKVSLKIDPTGFKLLKRFKGTYPLYVTAYSGSHLVSAREAPLGHHRRS